MAAGDHGTPCRFGGDDASPTTCWPLRWKLEVVGSCPPVPLDVRGSRAYMPWVTGEGPGLPRYPARGAELRVLEFEC